MVIENTVCVNSIHLIERFTFLSKSQQKFVSFGVFARIKNQKNLKCILIPGAHHPPIEVL
jgi:hypothetical protein